MKQSKQKLKTYFETGDKPTEGQYSDLIDSYVDSKQEKGDPNRRFVIDSEGEVVVASEQKIPEYSFSEVVNNTFSLLKDGVAIKEIDLTNYIDDTNLSRLISGSVGANGMATFTRDDDSTFEVDFNNFLNTIESKIPEYTFSEITGNKLSLLKDGVAVKEIDLSIYLDDTNLSRLISGSVAANGMATFTRDDNTTFTIDFSDLINPQVQANWNEIDNTKLNYIENKPVNLSDFNNDTDFITKKDVPEIQAGTNITIDNTDPLKPVVNSLSDGIEGIRSTGTLANNDNDVVIGNKNLGAYVSVSYRKGNVLAGENKFSNGYNIVDDLDFENVKYNVSYSETPYPKITHLARLVDSLLYRKSGVKEGRYAFEYDFTNGLKIKKELASFSSYIDGTIKSGLLTSSQDYELPNKSMTFAGLSDIPEIQAGSGITIDNTNPLKPIVNSSGGGTTDLSYTPEADKGKIVSSSGTDAIIPVADKTNAGLMKAGFYDQGFFLPRFLDGKGGGTYTYSGPKRGSYTRIGNMVTFNIEFGHVYTTGTPTGTLYIENLPFPLGVQPSISNATQTLSAVTVSSFSNTNITGINSVVGNVSNLPSGPVISFIINASILASSVTLNNSFVVVSGSYITDVYTS